VAACCYDFDGKMILGDLRRQSIAEIWHGQPYRRLREAHAAEDFSNWPMCEDCDRRLRPWIKLNPRSIGSTASATESVPPPLRILRGDDHGGECPAGSECPRQRRYG
jgi:hypothetical protein